MSHLDDDQRAVLLVTLAHGGATSAAALGEVLGEVLDVSATVERLRVGRLVETTPGGVELTEPGWWWCSQQLHAGPPAGSDDEMAGALYAVLDLIGRYLDRIDLSLGEWVAMIADPKLAAEHANTFER